MRRVCVFCGSRSGRDPAFLSAARRLGEELARSGRELVYGGGNVGLMGELANACLAAGGQVTGVIPRALEARELAHRDLTSLRVVETMHERKALMADLADGFIALPGGLGTLEEFFEVWTWGQLGLHAKPYGLLNVNRFYSPLLTFLDSLVAQGFFEPQYRGMVVVHTEPPSLIREMEHHLLPAVRKWVDRSER